MLVELDVENIGIIEKATMSFGPGLTAITGETGAGKSLMLDALALCLGDRADTDSVRTGASRAMASAVFALSPSYSKWLSEIGCLGEDGQLYVQREIAVEGRSQCRINGRLMPITILKTIGDALVDLHGQHDHQSLLHKKNHLELLDSRIGQEAIELRTKIAEQYEHLQGLFQRIAELETNERTRAQRVDLLRFQINEIQSANIQLGETAKLETELKRLKHSEEIREYTHKMADALYAGETSTVQLLREAELACEKLSLYDETFKKILEVIQNSRFSMEDAVTMIRQQVDLLDTNVDNIEFVAERLDLIARLKRKYGPTEESILTHLETSVKELSDLEQYETKLTETQEKISLLQQEMKTACEKLTKLRKKTAQLLSQSVSSELAELAMPHAQFSVSIQPKEPSADGMDEIEFMLSANKGEAKRPLSKVASGGEMSRLMLAIKTCLSQHSGVPILVFDEIDAGLGGQTASTVGKKLEELARHYQVIVITHLPQIAAKATTQYAISKKEKDGRVTVEIKALNHEERIEEIARMIAGDDVGNSALQHAKTLLSATN